LAVGFDSGKMIGRSTFFAMFLMTVSVKRPPTVLTPMRIVGFTSTTASARSRVGLRSRA
jgi:hypothetical protein